MMLKPFIKLISSFFITMKVFRIEVVKILYKLHYIKGFILIFKYLKGTYIYRGLIITLKIIAICPMVLGAIVLNIYTEVDFRTSILSLTYLYTLFHIYLNDWIQQILLFISNISIPYLDIDHLSKLELPSDLPIKKVEETIETESKSTSYGWYICIGIFIIGIICYKFMDINTIPKTIERIINIPNLSGVDFYDYDLYFQQPLDNISDSASDSSDKTITQK